MYQSDAEPPSHGLGVLGAYRRPQSAQTLNGTRYRGQAWQPDCLRAACRPTRRSARFGWRSAATEIARFHEDPPPVSNLALPSQIHRPARKQSACCAGDHDTAHGGRPRRQGRSASCLPVHGYHYTAWNGGFQGLRHQMHGCLTVKETREPAKKRPRGPGRAGA